MRLQSQWRPHPALVRPQPPPGLRHWLTCPGSLTRALVHACAGELRVTVLRQGWDRPHAGEAAHLGLGPHCRAVVRQVYLCCGERPWVYARTVIPHHALAGSPRRLLHLGNTSLGSVLFRNPSLRQGRKEVACMGPHTPLYRAAVAGVDTRPPSLWARRCLYYLDRHPVLVTEVFLPGIASSCIVR